MGVFGTGRGRTKGDDVKVILIEEDRFVDFTKAVKLQHSILTGPSDNTAIRLGWDLQMWRAACDEAQRRYHCEFVRWAQSHGASCVER